MGTGPPHHHRHHPRALGDAAVVPAGETVAVRVCGTVGETAALLGSVLAPEQAAAELLAAAAHRDVVLGDAALDGVALSIPPGDLAIWIDPIGERGARGWAGDPPPDPWLSTEGCGCTLRLHQRVHWGARGRGPRRRHLPRGAVLGAGAHRRLRPPLWLPRAGRHQRALLLP